MTITLRVVAVPAAAKAPTTTQILSTVPALPNLEAEALVAVLVRRPVEAEVGVPRKKNPVKFNDRDD